MLKFQQVWQKIKQNKSVSIPLIIITTGFVLFLLLLLTKPRTERAAEMDSAIPVTVMRLTPSTYTPYIHLYGRIESPETSDIESKVEADVEKVNVREGNIVDKGTVLVKLDDKDLNLILQQRQAEVAELEAEIAIQDKKNEMDIKALEHEKYLLSLAGKQVERQNKLIKTNAISELALDNSNEEMRRRSLNVTIRQEVVAQHENQIKRLEARLKRAKAIQAIAERDVEETNIKAPFSGKITKLNTSPGERIQAGEVILQIFNQDDVEIRAQIPEPYLEKASAVLQSNQGKMSTVYIDGRKYIIYLDRISGEVGQGRAGIDGLFKVITNGGSLSIGRIIQMKFLLAPENDVFAVPETALFNSDTVYKVEDNHLVGIKVERVGNTEIADNEKAVIIKSAQLKQGDKIIVNPLSNAITGLKVSIFKEIGLGRQHAIETK